MKRIVLLLFVFSCIIANAQWVSPGNGTTYTFADLVDITEGVVTVGENGYLVNADLTISTGDVLEINNQTLRVDFGEVLVTINGSMVCTNTSTRTKFYGLNETNHFSMCFENATARNKWLLAHPESKEAKNGAHIGLCGVNIDIKEEL